MREVKFRAWDTYDNRMKHKFTIGSVTNSDNNLWTCPTLWLEDTGWVNCDTLVLMQYTGLKDKNGVEIYEGDIVNVHSYTVTGLGKVGFNKGSFVFNKFEYPTRQVLHSFSEIEVIGNIYENPELLENN